MRARFFPLFILFLAGPPACAEVHRSFPFVSQSVQQVRDNDRRLILEAELLSERQTLAKAQVEFDVARTEENRVVLHRHTENVRALQRELDGAAGKRAGRVPRVTVRATPPSENSYRRAHKAAPSFWDPYNRDPESSKILTTQRSTP